MPDTDPLLTYRSKRDFGKTSEPQGAKAATDGYSFVVQKHAATRLHYDFRLELDGVMLSWAVPKGPSFDPLEKRMAVRTEDHPISYSSFEGTIPPKQYGAGTVIVWDRGTWEPISDPREGLAKGKLLFKLHGQKLAGLWELVRIQKAGEKQEPWILFKKRDGYAKPHAEYDVVSALPDSVIAKPLAPLNAAKQTLPSAKKVAGKLGIEGAIKTSVPMSLTPQLATLATGVPIAGSWVYEIKFDGYRLLCHIDRKQVRLITRGGHDWADKMPELVADLKSLGLKSAWLDGEIVVLDEHGSPSFNALQKSFDRSQTQHIVYFLFDVPYFEGYDLRRSPLAARRQLLKGLLDHKGNDRVRYSADFQGDPANILQSACKLGLEGVIAKLADAPYESKRTETWLKLKCKQRQEFVIGGYVDRSNGAREIGSLLLGVYDEGGRLLSAGSVGTGWDLATAAELKTKLSKIETDKSPFDASASPKKGRWSKRSTGSERWVKPSVVAEVEFAEWTPDGHIRHASFVGIRADKKAAGIGREVASSVKGSIAIVPSASSNSGIKVSNQSRVIDATTGLTKLDLVRYYESVSQWLIPHLKGRPCSLVRGPNGIAGELFFQKHVEKLGIPGVKDLDASLWPGHASLLEVPTAQAIASAAQMNVIEFHTWNANTKNIAKPDRMIFDLDPGEGVKWDKVQEAAMLTRSILSDLGLEAWLKTSGGKGLHVVVPLAPRLGWDAVKGFSQAVVQHLARVIPDRFVAKSGGSNRVGKIFVDYIRNSHGATTASAFSARARPGLGVSMPVSWDQLASLRGGNHWTIATAREYLSFQQSDPWASYWTSKQSLSGAMKVLGYKPPKES